MGPYLRWRFIFESTSSCDSVGLLTQQGHTEGGRHLLGRMNPLLGIEHTAGIRQCPAVPDGELEFLVGFLRSTIVGALCNVPIPSGIRVVPR